MLRKRFFGLTPSRVIPALFAGAVFAVFSQEEKPVTHPEANESEKTVSEKKDIPNPPIEVSVTEDGKKEAGLEPQSLEAMEHLAAVMELIRASYVDEEKVSHEKLVSAALEGMLRNLDPHSDYMRRELFQSFQKDQQDTRQGIGISLGVRESEIVILQVLEEGPAARVGILPGDRLVRVGDQLTTGLRLPEVIERLNAQKDEVRVTIQRPSTGAYHEMTLKRETIQNSTVRDVMLLPVELAGNYKIGLIRLDQFGQNSAVELAQAMNKLEKEGMEALVLDLRGNPGGLLNVAVDILSEFLPPGTVVVTTEGRKKETDPPPLKTSGRGGQRKFPLAVLIDHGSASASELVSAALQDLRRAVVVGTRSFGKGSVQSIIPLPNGDAVRMTIAKYYTPAHRTIHEHGVQPNIEVGLTPDEEVSVAKWRIGETRQPDASSSLVKANDRQLQRAADVLKGVLVFSKP